MVFQLNVFNILQEYPSCSTNCSLHDSNRFKDFFHPGHELSAAFSCLLSRNSFQCPIFFLLVIVCYVNYGLCAHRMLSMIFFSVCDILMPQSWSLNSNIFNKTALDIAFPPIPERSLGGKPYIPGMMELLASTCIIMDLAEIIHAILSSKQKQKTQVPILRNIQYNLNFDSWIDTIRWAVLSVTWMIQARIRQGTCYFLFFVYTVC